MRRLPFGLGGGGFLAGVVDHWTAREPVGNEAGPVTRASLEDPFAEGARWLHYGGTYRNFRHSPLEQLTPASVP